ncbi:S9 family peptidase [Pedobacter sp. SD-b]|uniref:S9 family peptidase n=1 Tax=Pedobacter segetis TaxID=2793069 RepID=A0ABS1BJY0_9SPHI|nr:S9 family peptidase [Pedobacter segetis]MBK0383182.1 S9 family peptidase [Pedobacter segetis]
MLEFCKKYFFTVCLIACVTGCIKSKKAEQLSTETFFKDPDQSSYQISPDGKFLSFLKPNNGNLNIYVRSLSDDKIAQVTKLSGQSVKYYFWAGNDKLFYMQEKDSLDNYQAYTINKDGSDNLLIKTPPKSKVEVIDQIKNDNNTILVAVNDRVAEYFDVYKLDINTGKRTLFIKNPGNIVQWVSDDNGNVNLAVGSDGVNETIYFRANSSQKFKPVITNNFRSSLSPFGFTNQPDHVYALSNLNRDKLALVDFNCKTGKEVKVIYENPNADIMDVVYSKTLKKLAYVTYEINKREIHFLDDRYKDMYEDIRTLIPNQEIKIVDKDQYENKFIVRTFTDKNPGSYYLYQSNTNKIQKLGDVNPQIKPEEMCEMKPISYQSQDGLTIHGYLTLPKGKKKSELPCIVFPHSGPSLRNTWGYNAEVQFLANRGFAVLQMNYRGSVGYGKSFRNAGYKQWGKLVQNDIADGVKWLINQNIADPAKIGVYGYGFGGFSALNQAIYYPELYKCAASYSGYINLFTYLKGFPAYYKPYQQMMNEIVGNPESDIDYLRYSSPIFQIDKIKLPLFIAQGARDSRVNVNETNQFVKELRKRQINVSYMLNENENHVFRDMNNRLAFYKQLGNFFGKQLATDK